MEFLNALTVFLTLYANFIVISALEKNETLSIQQRQQPMARTMLCSERMKDGKPTLQCSGFTNIPTNYRTQENQDHYSKPHEITVLDMSNGNHLQVLKTAEFQNANFDNLFHINIANSNIRTVERGAFRGLDYLIEINLSNNKIDSLDMEMFERNDNLQKLILSGNPIHQFIGDAFPPLPKLNYIDLQKCAISKIPTNAFKMLDSLQHLYLESNKLRKLEWQLFEGNKNLDHLYLEGNEWVCDCHMKFLSSFLLQKRAFSIGDLVVCSEPLNYKGLILKTVPQDGLICSPEITALSPVPASTQTEVDAENDLTVYAEMDNDLGLECAVEGYPQPDINWFKNGKPIISQSEYTPNSERVGREIGHDKGTINNNHDERQHIEILNVSPRSGNNGYKYQFTKLLTIHKVKKDDIAEYTCVAKNVGRTVSKKINLNLTNIPEEILPGTEKTSGKTWLWILIALMILLLIALGIVGFLIWRKHDKIRQQKLKNEVMKKFESSEIILDDTFSTTRSNKTEVNAPLIPRQNISEIRLNGSAQLPDVAQESRSIPSPSLSPMVFSPRPDTADLRRQFFTSQQSQSLERPSRPGSAMSVAHYFPPGRIQFGNSTNPNPTRFHDRTQLYRLANYPIRRPGSSQSLVYPEQQYNSRPILMRQFSGPAYATMRLPSRDYNRRPPSISSESHYDQRPGPNSGYVTLPRNFAPPPNSQVGLRGDSGFGPSVSPTESNYSTFSFASSTLPRVNRDLRSGVMYDTVGPRTTADGGSNLSLNKIGVGGDIKFDTLDGISQGLMSPTKGRVNKPRSRAGSATTPGSLRGRNDFFSFEPVMEEVVDGSDDLMAQLPSNKEIDVVFPKFQNQQPQTLDSGKFRKKKAPHISAIPSSRSRKPVRTFDYSKVAKDGEYGFDDFLDGDKDDAETPKLPSVPPPNKKPVSLNNIESIVEAIEGTEV